MEMMLGLWVRIKHKEDKTSEMSGGFLKMWQSLCHGSTLTHCLLSSSWQRHCWDTLPQAKMLQEDATEAVLQWRSELCVSCWARSPWTTPCSWCCQVCSGWLMETPPLSSCTGNCQPAAGCAAELCLLQTLRYLICKHLITHSLQ